MTLVRARLEGFALPLRRPMATAHERIEVRRGLLVTLVDEAGVQGFGEATPLPMFGTEDLETCRAALAASLEALVHGRDPAPAGAASATPCADFALSTAQADLEARTRGQRLVDVFAREHGATDSASAVESQVVVAGETSEAVAQSASAAVEAGASAFKLKVAVPGAGGGAPDLGRDVERVAALRECVGGAARVRLDANEGWSASQAEHALAALARFEPDFVEQPVARDDVPALARLRRAGVVPVAADEALQDGGWRRCLELEAASVFVLKPAALGGWRRAVDVARAARAANIRTVWTTLVDGAVGRAAAIALAAAFGERGEVHGLGTANWLARDLVRDVAQTGEGAGRIALGAGPGLGFEPVIEPAISDGSALVFERDGGRR